jgi:GTP cyclohydrolase IA
VASKVHLSWRQVHQAAEHIAGQIDDSIKYVAGIPRNGWPVAQMIASIKSLQSTPHCPEPHEQLPLLYGKITNRDEWLIVDDLADSGETIKPYINAGWKTAVLYNKPYTPPLPLEATPETVDAWIVFPWEKEDAPETNVTRLLEWLGEDPTRDGLLDTPKRVCKALREMTAGNDTDVASLLSTTFEADCDEIVVVRNIPYESMCEHHLLPFTGTVSVAYIPGNGRVVGLSKIPRVVQAYSKRLQLQEQMCRQIADALNNNLTPVGVAVIATGKHSCMSCRGVRSQGDMVTSVMVGAFREDANARMELLALLQV